jgi:hypothetical protein
MVIADGNLKYAILNAISGHWSEVNKKCTYHFDFKNGNPECPVVSINFASPVDYRVSFTDGTCFVEINNVKYKLWYRDNTKDIRLELHSTKGKLKLARIF